jgi:hypothetical protein
MSDSTYDWKPKERDYEKEWEELSPRIISVPLEQTPLKIASSGSSTTSKIQAASSPSKTGSNPQKQQQPIDPLRLSKENENIQEQYSRTQVDVFFAPWSSRKAGILQKYTTTEQIIIPAFVENVAPNVTVPVDKVKYRLEQLDQDDGDTKMLRVTQKEYIDGIDRFHSDLIETWESDKRVKSLKTAIRLSKMLGDSVEVAQFFPSKFVLVTDVLDTFGRLVFERVKKKSTIYDGDVAITLKDNFRAEDVGDHAKEICKNWFHKIYSIRELVPRIYCETALLACYRFIENDTYPDIIVRLAKMIRGIGDPLAAMYCHAYLVRKAHDVVPTFRTHLMMAFDDFLFYQSLFDDVRMQKQIERRGLTKTQYLDLYTPALDWILHCLAYRADQSLLRNILDKCKQSKNGILLNAILSSVQPQFICDNASQIIEYIKQTDPETFPRHQLYRTLGVDLVLGTPPDELKLKFLNEIWRDVTKLDNVNNYISIAEVYTEYPLKHLGVRETNILLGDILKHVTVDRKYLDLQPHLQSIISKVLSYYQDFHKLFAMDNFLPFLDLFRGSHQIEVNKSLLETFAKAKERISDPIVINTMFGVAKTVHDSITPLSFADEVRQLSKLICSFIQKVDFGKDVEKQLNFYVECRRTFANLDIVKAHLIRSVANLAMTTLKIAKGKHTKETSAFVHACIAYCYITIPSMDDPFDRLYLYLLAGHVALMNQALSQAESLFKAAITLIQEVPPVAEGDGHKMQSTEQSLVHFLKNFISTLIALPGHPEHGAFYLFNGLKKVVDEYPWDVLSTGRAEVKLAMLSLLCTAIQKQLPYHYPKIEGNDVLFGGTVDYQKEINVLIDTHIKELLEILSKLKESTDLSAKAKSTKIAMEFINVTVANAELNTKTVSLIMNLYALMDKSQMDAVYWKNTLKYLQKRKNAPNSHLYEQLLNKLST